MNKDELLAEYTPDDEPEHDVDEYALSTTRPSLRAVQVDQREVIKRPRDGFRSAVGIIRWLQAAAVVTLGELDDDLYRDLVVADDVMFQALLDADARARLFREPLDADRAETLRRDLITTHLAPACVRAYTTLETKASEYTERDVFDGDHKPKDLDPEDQQHTAMRPGYDEIDREQREALQEFWSGFTTEDEVQDWLQDLKDATNSQIPEDFAARVMHDETALDYLLGRGVDDDLLAEQWADWFLAESVLPSFAAGVRTLNPSEVIHASSGGVRPYGTSEANS
ncbi:hypothetical protein [Halocalculus aciditolerans]|uniref:Uncharacterized protein n=1 Tax=Halocalculus aciditolerans TaxID=1383812 RepID=A0A830F8E3_9EURY|nr:hypothetical protein [Halocalculus aciditolerans]GGL73392.1 hypothetical protein GCM10009039_34380 [Halocalculus aciditolerans]